ncbi:MAG: hypothetical protein JW814_11105 [Candidatus Krumholzibacteriota bacterium]|nr:hypothetical protein [Candidatus Krumholzibacteriota bacterium]
MTGNKRSPHIVLIMILISLCGSILAFRYANAGTQLRSSLLAGYDSYIDRFTILEDDTTEAIEEFYLSLANSLDWNNDLSRFDISNTFKFGNQTVNENLVTGFTAGSRKSLLFELRNNLRLKYFREGSDYTFGNDYAQSNLHMKISRYFEDRLKIASKTRVELVDFSKRTSFDYDYRYFDTGLEMEKGSYFDDFFRVGFSAGYRDVPDSTALSFNRFQTDIEFHLVSDMKRKTELSISADRREYRENTRSSSWIIYSFADYSIIQSDKTRYDLRIESEIYLYDDPSTTFFNTHFLRAGTGATWSAGEYINISIEPRLAGMFCDEFPEEQYREGSIVLGLELSRHDRFWMSCTYEPGRRDYLLEENDIYSDYYLNRLSLMGNVSLQAETSLNLFITHDPERHSRRDDDFSLTMISATLSRSF